ncbi:MAG: hypothetical protein ABIY50_09465 [Ignavibacteria bacterium]
MHLIKIFILSIVLFTNISFAQKKIAYCSNQSRSGFLQIFTMNEDGSGIKQLTDLEENCMKPRWSPDGKQLVFYSDKGLIYLIRNAESSTPITPFYLWSGYNPFFLPDGDQIMFNGEYEQVLSIFVIDTAQYGTEPSLVSGGGYSNMQVLSKDGNTLIYSTFEAGSKVIVAADLNDTTENYLKQISNNNEANLEPDISPDGTKIIYSSFDNNLKGTVKLNVNGNETSLTKGLGSSNVPRFSPDGKNISFVVINGSDVSLYIMDSEGNGKKDLNINGGSVGTFQWMDNDKIIYDAGTETKTNIGIVNIKTGNSKIILEGGFHLHPSAQN